MRHDPSTITTKPTFTFRHTDMEETNNREYRDSWGGWISTKVANAEAALSTALVGEHPTRSRSLHNLRDVAKAARLANHQRRCETDHHQDEVLPPITRRASGIDVTLSHAWGAVRRAAVAAMATFEDPPPPINHQNPTGSPTSPDHPSLQQTKQIISVQSDNHIGEVATSLCEMSMGTGAEDHTLSAKTVSHDCLSDYDVATTAAQKGAWDEQTVISDVTLSTSLSCADFSQDKDNFSSFADPLECTNPVEWEDVRTSTTSSNEDQEKEQLQAAGDQVNELAAGEHGTEELSCVTESASDETSTEELRELLDAFNTMFEQNGGTDCVDRVKEVGDSSLILMRTPVDLDEAVEKALTEAKQKLDEALERLDSAVRTKGDAICSENAAASTAAEAVIEETKENMECKDVPKRNATLLRDCSRLLAVFATKICSAILERIEGDKDVCTWSERVELVASVSTRGIPQLRIIAKLFAEAIEQGDRQTKAPKCRKKLARQTSRLAEAAVEHVVHCVALAVAAMQVEVAEIAYRCCA